MSTTTTDILRTVLVVDAKTHKVTLEDSAKNVENFEKRSDNSFAGIQKSYLKMAGVIVAGGYAAKKVFDFAKAGAQIRDLESAFKRMGGSATSLENLSSAVKGTIDDTTLMRMSNMAQMLGINTEQFAELLKAGKAGAQVMGVDVKFAIESIITGTARQSAMILDNLGIKVDAKKADEEYAKAINKTADALTDAEKKQAFINATIKAGNVLVGAAGTGGAVDGYNQLTTAFSNWVDGMKKSVSTLPRELYEFVFDPNAWLRRSYAAQGEAVGDDMWLKRDRGLSDIATKKPKPAAPPTPTFGGPFVSDMGVRQDEEGGIISGAFTRAGAFVVPTLEQLTMLDERMKASFDRQKALREADLQHEKDIATAKESINNRLISSYMGLAGNIGAAISAFTGNQKAQFFIQRGIAASTAWISGMSGATAALAPPPVGLGPVAGLALSRKLALMTKLNVAAILATGLGGAKSSAPGGGGGVGGGSAAMPVQAAPQALNIDIRGADKLVNREALAQMFFSGFGDMLAASGGSVGNVRINYVES